MANFYTFQKNVTTSGTPVRLNDQTVEPGQPILIKAKVSNTGDITLGFDNVSAAHGSGSNFTLEPGASQKIVQLANTNQIWIDSFISGEGVEVMVGGSGGSSDDSLDEVSLADALTGVGGDGIENDNILVAPFRRPDAFHAALNATSSTSVQAVKAATADKKHYITDLIISTDTAQWVSIVDGASTVLVPPIYMAANSFLSKHFLTPVPGSINTALNVDCGGAVGNVSVEVDGYTI